MIAVDTNILVYAHRVESNFHERASRALAELSQASAPWALPWPCLHEFFGIVTNPRLYRVPTPMPVALSAATELVDAGNTVLIGETDRHWDMLRELISKGHVVGSKIHDARIAAICLEHGVATGDVHPQTDIGGVVDLLMAAYAWTYRLAAWEDAGAEAMTAAMDRQIGLIADGFRVRG